MKQHITEEQLDELTPKQRASFNKWIGFPEGMTGHKREIIRLITIGQMIEFLGDDWWRLFFTWDYGSVDCEYQLDGIELCDALWSACKEALNG